MLNEMELKKKGSVSKMSKKDNKELESTKATGTFVVETDHGIETNIGYSAIMQPNVKFSGKPMKWFDDTKLLKKK